MHRIKPHAPLLVISVDSAQKAISIVFRQPEYSRSFKRTLFQEVIEWISSLFGAINSAMLAYPQLKGFFLAALVLLALLVAGRAAYARQMGMPGRRRKSGGTRSVLARDPWAHAQDEALAGRYLVAAHALYLAVLEAIAGSDRVTIDSAKTVGDYTRELRRLASDALPLYREFATAYEPIVWGSRDCDRSCYEQLSGIAARLTGRSR